MGYMKYIIIFNILKFVAIGFLWHYFTKSPPLPELTDTWWGPGQETKVDESIRPFKISIPDEVLDDLQDRLELALNFTAPLEDTQFQYGFNTDYLNEVLNYWIDDYSWRDRETFLNTLPHFKTKVAGIDLHFIHVKPTVKNPSTRVLPLLLLHGWPGSVREFYDLIPLLTTEQNGRDFVFEVVCPSLPGYGFSEGAHKPGLGAAEMAVVMKALMKRVGFDKFYAQGGDWGGIITTNMATLFPENVLGLHSNMCGASTLGTHLKMIIGSFWPSLFMDEQMAEKMYPLTKKFSFLIEETGYMHIQSTKPDTIGVALGDSPIGLAAYILEKFTTWTEPAWKALPDGGLTKKFTLNQLLDNVMIYYVTGSITTSMRLYSETFNSKELSYNLNNIPCEVPTACASFPNELALQPESLLKHKYYNLVKFTSMPRGGHFAAFEEPQLLADDIWDSVALMENARIKAESERVIHDEN